MFGFIRKLLREGLINEGEITYSAVVLEPRSKDLLLQKTRKYIPENFEEVAHHMTITYGKELPNKYKENIGDRIELKAYEIGISDDAIAVKVKGFYSEKKMPHITVAIPPGGKAKDSDKIEEWKEIQPFKLYGNVQEIE